MIYDLNQSAKCWLADCLINFKKLDEKNEPLVLELHLYGVVLELRIVEINREKQ